MLITISNIVNNARAMKCLLLNSSVMTGNKKLCPLCLNCMAPAGFEFALYRWLRQWPSSQQIVRNVTIAPAVFPCAYNRHWAAAEAAAHPPSPPDRPSVRPSSQRARGTQRWRLGDAAIFADRIETPSCNHNGCSLREKPPNKPPHHDRLADKANHRRQPRRGCRGRHRCKKRSKK